MYGPQPGRRDFIPAGHACDVIMPSVHASLYELAFGHPMSLPTRPVWIRLKLKFQADVIGVSAVISACANSAKWVHALSALQMHAVNVPRLQL